VNPDDFGELPSGWVWTNVGEACLVIQGQSPPGSTYNTNSLGIPFLQGKAEFGLLYPEPVKYCSSPSKIALPGDILISIRAPVGPTNLCAAEYCIGRGLAAIRTLGSISVRYIFYALRATEEKLRSKSTGTTFEAIRGDDLRRHSVPLAPLLEQHRIVAEIEMQFTRLDAAVAALKRAQANLKRYRASVLKAACVGRLVRTEAELARTEGREYEHASVLLERIQKERQAKLGTKQLRMQLEGEEPETHDMSELPEGWVWTTVGEVTNWPIEQGGPQGTGEFEYIDISSIDNKAKRIANPKRVSVSQAPSRARQRLQPGDVLVSMTRPNLNAVALVTLTLTDAIASTGFHILRGHSVTPAWLFYLVQTDDFIKTMTQRVQGALYPAVRPKDITSYRIPLPPLGEQLRIMQEIDRRLSVLEELDRVIDHGLTRAERLRQSILKLAFEGKLVSQDASDEPASVLLERMGAERAASLQDYRKPMAKVRRAAEGKNEYRTNVTYGGSA